jgi:uncharacterized membrane protein
MPQHQTVAENIQAIVDLEEGKDRQRSLSDRIADMIGSFAGTVVFVLVHLIWFGLWTAINVGSLRLGPAFDPYPFQLLCMLVSLEGVLLSTFVLIRQNRMSLRADRRSHLDLQINLLAEKEVSKVIQMLERISDRLEVPVDQETKEMGQMTAVAELARELDQKLPEGV